MQAPNIQHTPAPNIPHIEAPNIPHIESELRLRARQIDELIDRAKKRKLEEELSACLTRQAPQNRRTWTYLKVGVKPRAFTPGI